MAVKKTSWSKSVGRVVKNAPASDEKYVVAPPPLAAPTNGKSHIDDPDEDFEGIVDFEAPLEPLDPPEPEVQPVDWEALHREAAELIDSAAADAEAILSEARERSRDLLEAAQRSVADVTAEAQESGQKAGHAEGVDAAQREMDEMLGTMRGLIDMARAERHKIVEGAEPEIVKLAMGVAERILHKAVEIDREVVVAMAKAAISHLVNRESLTVRVNPIDLERMKAHRDEVLALGETKHMRVIEDQRIDPGGVIVETESGTLDAKVGTQVNEAKRILNLQEDEIIVEPPAESPLRAVPPEARAS